MNKFKNIFSAFMLLFSATGVWALYFPEYMKPQVSGDKPLLDNAYIVEKADQKSFEIIVKIKKEKPSDKISLWFVKNDTTAMIPINFEFLAANDDGEFKSFKINFDLDKIQNNKSITLPDNAVIKWDAASSRKGLFYQFYYNYSHRLFGIYNGEQMIGGIYLFNLEPRDEVNRIIIPENLPPPED